MVRSRFISLATLVVVVLVVAVLAAIFHTLDSSSSPAQQNVKQQQRKRRQQETKQELKNYNRKVQCHGRPSLSLEQWLDQPSNNSLQLCDPTFVPSSNTADMSKPVKVFIMMGQSNMLGMGRVHGINQDGTLEHTVKRNHRFSHLFDDTNGHWSIRYDVRNVGISEILDHPQRPYKNEWLTINGTRFGPDIQFGYIMAETLQDEPILILKSCIGNRALGWDLLPPGSPRFDYDGFTYAGYGESPDKWPINTTKPPPINWYAGLEYDMDVKDAHNILKNLPLYYPSATNGYEITGFVWWQGERDRKSKAYAEHYESNLVRLIKQLRTEFGAPQAKFVLATIGFGGFEMSGTNLTVVNAQLAVSTRDDGSINPKYQEFCGNVKAMDIRASYRWGDAHYGLNADTYMEVGNALGLGMAKLLLPSASSAG